MSRIRWAIFSAFGAGWGFAFATAALFERRAWPAILFSIDGLVSTIRVVWIITDFHEIKDGVIDERKR